jgi:hypothetical protein
VPTKLDWEEFTAKYFPGSRRHDFEALITYAAHRRSSPIGGGQRPLASGAESAALHAWEDEGGPGPGVGLGPIPTAAADCG